MKRFALLICTAMVVATGTLMIANGPAAATEGAWKSDFDKVCGQTDNAAEMPIEELKKNLARCDSLKSQIELLEATPRKIYLKRLQMCRNLLNYLIEAKGRQ